MLSKPRLPGSNHYKIPASNLQLVNHIYLKEKFGPFAGEGESQPCCNVLNTERETPEEEDIDRGKAALTELFEEARNGDTPVMVKRVVDDIDEIVRAVTGPRNIPLSALMQCKYPLARKVRERIADIRAKERSGVYQRSLFAPEAKPEISFDNGFVFADDMFVGVRTYRGSYRFSKHFTGWDQIPAFDGADDGEELNCAKMLDSLPEVKHWIRNVPRHPSAFWLPTASGKFYPDFVAELTDGRILVVEYKGAHLTDAADTDEKRAIGALWEKASGSKGLFLMAEKQVDGKDVRGQMLAKVR